MVDTVYRAPLRHIGEKDYAPYAGHEGLIAVVQFTGGQWQALEHTDWGLIAADVRHVELRHPARIDSPVYGIFERAPS